jgi:hypothetical protein
MRIREFQETDVGALSAMHAQQGFEYAFPDLANPLFVSKLVLEGKSAEAGTDTGAPATAASSCDAAKPILMASLVRLTCEAYLLVDRTKGTPRDRYLRMLLMQREAAADLRTRGLEDVHAWLPPRIAQRFGRRLTDLGWVRDDCWIPYCLKL